jgi:hypothetical protein
VRKSRVRRIEEGGRKTEDGGREKVEEEGRYVQE